MIFPPSKLTVPRTYCVLGVPRGGTTMVAGMLQKLGIFMGQQMTPDREDSEFITHRGNFGIFTVRNDPAQASYLKRIAAVIATRNQRQSVWGWKDPIAVFYLPAIVPLLRNPHYVFITRDLGAVAQREVAEAGTPDGEHLLAQMRRISVSNSMIVEFITTTRAPTLMISYERALSRPEAVAEAMLAFTGRQDPGFVEWSRDFIRPRKA